MISSRKLIYQIPKTSDSRYENGIVEAAPIRDQIADILRRKIIRGELENDEKLSERRISAELNVSTTPVKEAFRQLQAEGLIYTLPRKGSYVSVNVVEHMYQVILLRSAIEGVAAYMAAKRMNDEIFETIQMPLEKAGELIEHNADDYDKISYYNRQIHEKTGQS